MKTALLLLGFSWLLLGQISSGSFYGSIEDPSGGLLAGAHPNPSGENRIRA
jgi:hypothetical protein